MPQTTADLLNSYAREFILLFGKDGVGKSCNLVSLAAFIEAVYPDAVVHVIDTEHKFAAALRHYGAGDPPANISCHIVNDIDGAVTAQDSILSSYKQGDWLFVESMSRVWEHAQNATYMQLYGVTKREFLDMKKGTKTPSGIEKKGSPLPGDPKLFWQVAKGIYDPFAYNMVNADDLNCVWTTTIGKERSDDQQQFKSAERDAIKLEFGIDCKIEGQPRLPYQVQTTCMLERVNGVVTCKILRDVKMNWGTSFEVPNRDAWAEQFWTVCRG